MKHGIIQPEELTRPGDDDAATRLRQLVHLYRYFIAMVILPTALVAFYQYVFASNQYESQADFIIRKAEQQSVGNGFGQLFGMNFGASASSPESFLVADYLLSHDSVSRLRKEDQLVERFRRPGTDWISRLWFASPSPEKLLSYYRKQVTIEQNAETGLTHLRVHAFSPQDAYAINRKLLLLGEERINALNERTYRDQVASSRRELEKADADLAQIQLQMTQFRRSHDDIDPEGSGKAQIGLVTGLTGNLVAARAQLQAMQSVVSPSSPQYRAVQAQVRALEAQVAGQSSRIAGNGSSIASSLGDYEGLVVRRENAARRYVTVAQQYEQAKAEANKQQLYLIRVVEPNMPVKSLFPERGKIVLTVFFSLALAYAIGWLLVAGVKEHSL